MEILVVISDQETADTMRQRICDHGHHAMLAGTIQDAVDIASRTQFELSFIHLCMPDGDGRDLIKYMKTCFPEMPIVAMTDSNSRLLELSARQLGIIYYMVEPFGPAEPEVIIDHLSKKASNY